MSRGFRAGESRSSTGNGVKAAREAQQFARRDPEAIAFTAQQEAKKFLGLDSLGMNFFSDGKQMTSYEKSIYGATVREISENTKKLLTPFSQYDKFSLTPEEQKAYDENSVYNRDYVPSAVREDIFDEFKNTVGLTDEKLDEAARMTTATMSAIAAREYDYSLKARMLGTMDMRDVASQITSMRSALFNGVFQTAVQNGLSKDKAAALGMRMVNLATETTMGRAERIKSNKGGDFA